MRTTLTGKKPPSDAPLILFVAIGYMTVWMAILAAIGGVAWAVYSVLQRGQP